MAANETVIRLLLVEDQLEDAEQLISILRNGGIAVRPLRPTSIEELVAQLNENTVDLVLASLDATHVSFADAVKAVNASGKDIPIIATASELDEDRVIGALVAGARDFALCGRPEHLRLVVRNEFAVLEHRRHLRLLEAALHDSERRCNSLINSSRDPIAYVHEGMHIRANDAYLEMYGYESFDELEGLPLLDMVARSDTDRFKQLLKDLARGEPPPRSLELKSRRADGSEFDATMEFAQANYEGEPCLQIIIRQRAMDAEMVRELDELRYRDQTTGLFNRRYFLEQLENAVAAAAAGRNDQLLLLIEPDRYSTLLADIGIGHTDELLERLGGRLRETVGESATCALFSDHGFALLKTDSAPADGVALAERIRAAFEGFIVAAGERSVNITVSIGGVQIGEKIARLQEVLGKAGQAVSSCISLGGNQIEIFDPSARDRAESERISSWVKRIQQALKENGFVLHYQPIISLNGIPGESYEVLVRMKSPNGEIAMPQSFMPIAEEHGLLDDIDRWVVTHAIEVLAERKKANKHTTLFVKVTPASLMDGGLGDLIPVQIKKHGVPGNLLVLEIPESKVFTNLRATQELFKAIQPLGCRITLEQFGSGLNSFQLLSHTNPSFLKIDRSFMDDLAKSPEHQAKLRDITQKGHEAGKQVIAEFVQDAASMSVLFSIGVDYVEGHFLAPAGAEMNYDFS
jgi:diguanylate cyclase (GGDEF)-like protein/PAS domain S-box-containing protein